MKSYDIRQNRTMKNDWKYTFSIVAINERTGNSSSLDRKFFFFLITSSRPLPSLLQQPTENFTTVASKLEATIMIRAEILCLKKTEPKAMVIGSGFISDCKWLVLL